MPEAVLWAVAVLVLGLLIVVHEFGHFIVAKRVGVGVLKFSVGFGPKILGRVVNGTEYVLSAIPLGGFVKMIGEDPDASEESEPVDPSVSFSHQALWKRVAIVLAGPGFNIVFAFLAFVATFAFFGMPVPSEEPRIGGVMDGAPADRAGLKEGDIVVSVDGAAISSWSQLSSVIRASGGNVMELVVRRAEGSTTTLQLKAEKKDERNESGEVTGSAFLIGIVPSSNWERVGWVDAVPFAAERTSFWIKATLMGVVNLLRGRVSREEIGGPLQIISAARRTAEVGFAALLQLTALISINLGVLNLLPIPVLDGGHLLLFSFEAIRRRPLELRHREIAQQIGLVILVSLMMFVFYNDIARMIRG